LPRNLLVGVLIGLLAGGGCAPPGLIVRTDRGQAVTVDLQKVRPVEYRKEDLQAAMEIFAEHVAEVIQHQAPKLRVRLVSSDPMTEAYLAWCDRRNAPGDCLELLDARSPGISNDGKRSIAVRMAFGTALEEVAGVVRHVDPMKVEALLLIWFTIYFASFVFPDATITKALAFVMSASMVAFLGWDGFRTFVLGYRDMCQAADAAQTFAALYDAGRAFGNRMGPSMVRIVTALVTLGLSSATGMSVPVTRLPGGGQAVANAEAMGFRLGAVSSGSVSVSATGTISLVFANEATIAGRGGAQTSTKDSNESGRVVCPRGPGAATGPVPKGYVPVSRWVNEAEAKLWIKNGGTYIPQGIGGESGRVYVTVPEAPRPGGTGPIRIDFAVPSAALNAAGKEGWFQIMQPVQNMPIYNVTLTCPPGM